MKIKIFLLMLDIGWDDGRLTEVMTKGLISEGYEAKSLRVPMYVWEEKGYLEKIRAKLMQFSPDVVMYYFRAIASPESIEFLNEVFEIYAGKMRPATLMLSGHSHFYPPPEYEYLLDGHISFPFGSESILRAIDYILKKERNGKMLHL